MSKKPSPDRPVDSAPAIRISPELSKPLKDFADQCGMPVSQIVRVGLGFLLPRLAKGEFSIVNGELRETRKAA